MLRIGLVNTFRRKRKKVQNQKVIIRGLQACQGPLAMKLDKPLTILVSNNGAGSDSLELFNSPYCQAMQAVKPTRAFLIAFGESASLQCNGMCTRSGRPGHDL